MYGEKILQAFGESGKSGKSTFKILLEKTECNPRLGVSRSKSMTELSFLNQELSQESDPLNYKYLDIEINRNQQQMKQKWKESSRFSLKSLDVLECCKRPLNSGTGCIGMSVFASTCEAIKGILTMCEQDFPKASPFLDGHLHSLLFAKSVHIFTEYPYRRHFDSDSKEKTRYLTFDAVIKTIKDKHKFSIVVFDGSSQASFVEALNVSDMRNLGVLIINTTEELQVLPNVFISKTDPINIKQDAEYLLERCAFGVLSTVYSNLKRFRLNTALSTSDEAKIRDIFDLIKSSFETSGIPSEEIPDIAVSPKIEYPANIEEIIQTITTIPGVIVCFSKRAILQIYIDPLEGCEDTKENIRGTLHRYNLEDYNISYGKALPLAQCASGDSVCQSIGTPGGFVKKVALPSVLVREQRTVFLQDCVAFSANTNNNGNVSTGLNLSETNAPTTAALVSRHVVQRMDPPVLLVDSIRTQIGRIVNVHHCADIDILPIDINEAYKHLCDPRFRTELNVSMYSKLRKSEDIGALRGKPVHIWGAKSKPGYGILVQHDARTANGLRVIIRDRRTGEPFAQQGDSGAMVCFFDPRNEILYAVAMLINAVQLEGEETHRRYTAQILDDSLQKLSIVNGCQFLIFEDETETSEYE